MAASYIVENEISSLGVTKTLAGVTRKEILGFILFYVVAYSHGIIQGISRKFLDPRRPDRQLTNFDKEEGLLRYFAAIPIHAPHVLSYHQQIFGISSIQTAPCQLESTSIIVSSGVDIFCTLRAPSKQFDTLSNDFAYSQLLATLIALFVGVYFSNQMKEAKRIREAWVS